MTSGYEGLLLLVMFFAGILLIGLRYIKSDQKQQLGTRRRRISLTLVLIGLSTAIIPSIKAVPPVLGRENWSPLGIVLQLKAGNLRFQDSAWTEEAAMCFVAIYVALFLVMLALTIHPSPKFIGGAAVLGLVAIVGGRGTDGYSKRTLGLESILFGNSGRGSVDHFAYSVVILMIMLSLMGVTYFQELD